MPKADLAKKFQVGDRQALVLPGGFRLPGNEARVCRVSGGTLIEPVVFDVEARFAEMDGKGAADFLEGWERDRPPVPAGRASFG